MTDERSAKARLDRLRARLLALEAERMEALIAEDGLGLVASRVFDDFHKLQRLIRNHGDEIRKLKRWVHNHCEMHGLPEPADAPAAQVPEPVEGLGEMVQALERFRVGIDYFRREERDPALIRLVQRMLRTECDKIRRHCAEHGLELPRDVLEDDEVRD